MDKKSLRGEAMLPRGNVETTFEHKEKFSTILTSKEEKRRDNGQGNEQ